MDTLVLILLLAILSETSYLVFTHKRPIRTGKRRVYVDTSALIDGRILNVARTGFLDGDLVILRDVLLELQLLADSKDSEKRTRARAGLEAVSELERVININTEIIDEKTDSRKVDEILLKLAKKNKAAILTIDYNLIKVAEAEKIEVLNINDLVLALKNEFLPGEKVNLKISEKGSGRGQGVGHLPNGAMVVVEKAANKVGKIITVELVRLHETSAGRMFFAKQVRKK